MNVIELHDQVWSGLQARRSQLPHALLLIGQRGIGKFELATRFAASLLCEQPQPDGQACGQCLACNWFAQGNHPDFRLLQPDADSQEEGEEGKKKASQQITIEQVRSIEDFLNVGTHRAGLRVILLNPVETMNRNAANALLKSLEEPTTSTLFLLVSSEPLRLLPTIRSRCQSVPVPVPGKARCVASLRSAGVTDPERWLALAGGSPLLAAELAASGQTAWLDLLVQRLAGGRQSDPLASAAELEKQVKEGKGKLGLRQIVDALQKWLVDLNFAAKGLPVRYFLPQEATIGALAAMIPPVRLLHAYRDLHARRREAEQPVNARLFLEGLFLDYRALFVNDRPR